MTDELPSSDLYDQSHRALQAEFDTARLADALKAGIVTSTLGVEQQEFIESRDFFFLSTLDASGWPTVSYKGGPVGVVHIVDDATLMFPIYDGNGMFLSAGNIEAQSKIGLLFIDLETPHRLRVHATASLVRDEESVERFPGSQLVVKATIENVFVNCVRYIHKHERITDSPYVPDDTGAQPYPTWKRIDLMQPYLPESDAGRTSDSGGPITAVEYHRRLDDGRS